MCKPPDTKYNLYYMEYRLHDLQGEYEDFKTKKTWGRYANPFSNFFWEIGALVSLKFF